MAKPVDKPPAEAKGAAALTKQRIVTPLTVTRWSEAQFVQQRHCVRPEANTRFEDLLDPAYFAHIAPKVNAHDIIEVRPADASYYGELYVWAKGANWLQVSEIKKIERPRATAVPASDNRFSIDFVDGPAKHRVIRKSDSQSMAEGFDSPEAANAWLTQNRQRLAA